MMKKYYTKHLRSFIIGLLFCFIYSVLISFVPIYAGFILDSLKPNFFLKFEFDKMIIISAVILTSVLISGMLKIIFNSIFLRNVRRDLETDLFGALIHGNIPVSESINAFTVESDQIISGYFRFITSMVQIFVPFIIALSYTFVVSWLTILIIIACFILLIFLNQILLKPLGKILSAVSENNSRVNKIIAGFLGAITSIKIFGGTQYALKRICSALNKRNKAETEKAKYEVYVEAVNDFFSTLMQLIPLAVVALMVINGKLNIGTALSIMLLFEKIVSPIDSVSGVIKDYKGAQVFIKKFENIIGTVSHESLLESNSEVKLSNKNNMYGHLIQTQNLSVAFDENVVLKNLNLVINHGKYLILGRNGAGKTTFFKVLTKQINDYSGNIYIKDKNLNQFSESELFEVIGIIPQEPELFTDTVRNNITFGREENAERLKNALRMSGFSPKRLDDIVGEDSSNFSGGELHRIVLARMFYNEKEIYLLDEVLSGLERGLAEEIEKTLLEQYKGTVVHISHKTENKLMSKYNEVISFNAV